MVVINLNFYALFNLTIHTCVCVCRYALNAGSKSEHAALPIAN